MPVEMPISLSITIDHILLGVTSITLLLTFLMWLRVRQNIEKVLRDELREARDDAARYSRELREEVSASQSMANELLVKTVNALGDDQKELLGNLTHTTNESAIRLQDQIEKLVQKTSEGLKEIQSTNDNRFEGLRKTIESKLQAGDEAQQRRSNEVIQVIQKLTESNRNDLSGLRETIHTQLMVIQTGNEEKLEKVRLILDERLGQAMDSQRKGIETFGKIVTTLTDTVKVDFSSQRERLQSQLNDIQKTNEDRFDKVRQAVDEKLKQVMEDQRKHLADMIVALKGLEKSQQQDQEKARETLNKNFLQIQESNQKKLDEMRRTVDEKLHDTLEKRLGESFRLVSDRLEAVHKGLGEMQTLAMGVGDLKRVLTNVKIRGTWAEVQLGAILEQILTPDQWAKNVCVKDESLERVEYAIRLPGPKDDPDACVWLPIDSKFPQEDYLRLQEAAERAEPNAVQAAMDALARTVRVAAKDIREKYVNPPITTDFGIMFLATEGLYAEILRQPSLVEDLQQRQRVVVAGPTTLAAILSSLRMGFQTVVIEQRAAEVWRVLGAIKTEFGKFGDVLDKVKRQLNTASRTIEQTGVRSRAMERRLRSVEQLPETEASAVLSLTAITEDIEPDDLEVEATADSL